MSVDESVGSAAMLIRVWIEGSQPLAGTAAVEGGEPLRFDGWLELLRVVSELGAMRKDKRCELG